MPNVKSMKSSLYHIGVKGTLDAKWADWFDGLVLTSLADAETLLRGRLADQVALQGILNKINRLGLFLILVAQIEDQNYGSRYGEYQEQVEES